MGTTMRIAALLTALTLIAGCGGDGDDGAAQSGGGGSAELSEPITFETSGGDAFRQDKITVRPDGSVRVETRSGDRSSKLTADELSELGRVVEQVDLASTASAKTEPVQPDMLYFRFTYRGREVETDDGAMPERLAPLVRTFLELIDAHGP